MLSEGAPPDLTIHVLSLAFRRDANIVAVHRVTDSGSELVEPEKFHSLLK